MSNESKSTFVSPQTIEWLKEQHPSVYSNILAVGITPFDLSIVFGEVAGANPSSVMAKPLVKILISPEQASMLMQLLQQSLRIFTEGNGPLRPVGARALDPQDFKFGNIE